MKKFLLLFLLLASISGARASSYYMFAGSTSTYAELANPTIVTTTFPASEYKLNLGVSFKLFGTEFGTGSTNLKILRFGAMYGDNADDDRLFALDGFLVKDFTARDETSSISYTLEGDAGARVLKVQFKNAGLKDGAAEDFVNFQMWLYEDGSRMEVHIGPLQIADPSKVFIDGVPGPSIGEFLSDMSFMADYETQFLDGDAASPTISGDIFNNLDNVPAANSVYKFIHSTEGIFTPESRLVLGTAYPNPGSGVFTIASASGNLVYSVNVYSLSGKLVKGIRQVENNTIDISELAPGTYVLSLSSADRVDTILVTKK